MIICIQLGSRGFYHDNKTLYERWKDDRYVKNGSLTIELTDDKIKVFICLRRPRGATNIDKKYKLCSLYMISGILIEKTNGILINQLSNN